MATQAPGTESEDWYDYAEGHGSQGGIDADAEVLKELGHGERHQGDSDYDGPVEHVDLLLGVEVHFVEVDGDPVEEGVLLAESHSAIRGLITNYGN